MITGKGATKRRSVVALGEMAVPHAPETSGPGAKQWPKRGKHSRFSRSQAIATLGSILALRESRLTRAKQTSATLDLYSHVTATMQEDAADRLDAAFRGAINGLERRK